MSLYDEVRQAIIDGANCADETNSSNTSKGRSCFIKADPVSYAAGNVVNIINDLLAKRMEEAFEKGRVHEREAIIKNINGRA